jgi:hypothetical protein
MKIMKLSRSLMCMAVLAALASAPAASGSIVVFFEPEDPTVEVGETVDVEIRATIDQSVVAWGLDLIIDKPLYAGWTSTVIGPLWDSTTTLDLDGLAGVRFPPGVTGDVLLATLTLEGLSEGETLLSLGVTPEEDEGLLWEVGGLATGVQFDSATLTVTPEPTTLALLMLSSCWGLRRRRR